MANRIDANVITIDTTGTLSATMHAKHITVDADGGSNASLTIKKGGSGGQVIYDSKTVTSGADQREEVDIWIVDPYFTISGNGTARIEIK